MWTVNKQYLIALTLASAVALAGCATVMRGTTDVVRLISHPEGAEAKTSIGFTCVTPCAVEVSKQITEFSVTFSRKGYLSQTYAVVALPSTVGSGYMMENVVLGGMIGIGVDSSTGAANDHKPNPVEAYLSPG